MIQRGPRSLFWSVLAGALVALGIAGCAVGGSGVGMAPAPNLGVLTDEELRVVDIARDSAAEKAGLRPGDLLVDLTWIPSDAPAYSPPSDTGGVTLLNGTFFQPTQYVGRGAASRVACGFLH